MSKAKWLLRINQARELRKQGAAILFQRVSLLNECYENEDFRAWCAANNHVDLGFLDAELEDVACDFLTLKAVLANYPAETDWKKNNLRNMMAEKECERLRGEMNSLSARVSELQGALAIVSRGKCPLLESVL